MDEFDKYLSDLAGHEVETSKSFLDPRKQILVNAGIHLNWLGDFLANPDIKFEKKDIPVNRVVFTGTNPGWNEVLIDQCERSVKKFQDLIKKDQDLKNRFSQEASFGDELIVMRGPDEQGYYRVIDGMHRFVGAVIKNKKSVSAYIAINENEHLPICEAHTVYDLIRGFQRHARDKEGKTELYNALKLLARTYENVIDLLENRFNFKYVPDEEVQEIIQKVVKEKRV